MPQNFIAGRDEKEASGLPEQKVGILEDTGLCRKNTERNRKMHGVIEASDSEFCQHWNTLYANDPVQNPLYMQQGAQLPGVAAEKHLFTDRSFLVIAEDEPVFGCSLTLHVDQQGRNCMGYFGLEASTHVNRLTMMECSNNFNPEAIRLLQQHIHKLIEEIQPHSVEYLDPISCGIMSPVTQVLLLKGGKLVAQKAEVIDLSLSRRTLYRNVSKSCRGWIEWGRRNLEIEILIGRSFDNLNLDYTNTLSLNAKAGLANSSISPRLAYEKLIQQGNGFLVQGRNKDNLVFSALFAHTDRTCHFVCADVSTDSHDRPVLPALIWEAMLHSKARNCSQFDLGRYSISESSEPADLKNKFSAKTFGGESHSRLMVTLIE